MRERHTTWHAAYAIQTVKHEHAAIIIHKQCAGNSTNTRQLRDCSQQSPCTLCSCKPKLCVNTCCTVPAQQHTGHRHMRLQTE